MSTAGVQRVHCGSWTRAPLPDRLPRWVLASVSELRRLQDYASHSDGGFLTKRLARVDMASEEFERVPPGRACFIRPGRPYGQCGFRRLDVLFAWGNLGALGAQTWTARC